MFCGLSLCLFVGHNHELCKNGWTDPDAISAVDLSTPNGPCIRWGPRERVNFLEGETPQQAGTCRYFTLFSFFLETHHYYHPRPMDCVLGGDPGKGSISWRGKPLSIKILWRLADISFYSRSFLKHIITIILFYCSPVLTDVLSESGLSSNSMAY